MAAGTEEGKGGGGGKSTICSSEGGCRLEGGLRGCRMVMSRAMTCVEYRHNVVNLRHVL